MTSTSTYPCFVCRRNVQPFADPLSAGRPTAPFVVCKECAERRAKVAERYRAAIGGDPFEIDADAG